MEQWTDVTHLGSDYEEQLSSSGEWRHRKRTLNQPGQPACYADYPWLRGRAPAVEVKPKPPLTNDELVAEMRDILQSFALTDNPDVGVWISDFGVMLKGMDDIITRARALGLKRCAMTLQAAKDKILQPVEGAGADDDVS